jgi:hypothetical protein
MVSQIPSLNERSVDTIPSNSLVRFRGMVQVRCRSAAFSRPQTALAQDVLDPEYYPACVLAVRPGGSKVAHGNRPRTVSSVLIRTDARLHQVYGQPARRRELWLGPALRRPEACPADRRRMWSLSTRPWAPRRSCTTARFCKCARNHPPLELTAVVRRCIDVPGESPWVQPVRASVARPLSVNNRR